MIRLLLADDPVVRDGLRARLASQPDFQVAGEAADGAVAVTVAAELRPDVILMDLRMPALDGVTAIRQIRARQPAARILVLTTYDTHADILPAIEVRRDRLLAERHPARRAVPCHPRHRGRGIGVGAGSGRAADGQDARAG